jgi:hypothetical protein
MDIHVWEEGKTKEILRCFGRKTHLSNEMNRASRVDAYCWCVAAKTIQSNRMVV